MSAPAAPRQDEQARVIRDFLLTLTDDAAGHRLRHAGDACADCWQAHGTCPRHREDHAKAALYEALYAAVEDAPTETGALSVFINAAMNGGTL